MEKAPENGKESPHSAHANGMNGMNQCLCHCSTNDRLGRHRSTGLSYRW